MGFGQLVMIAINGLSTILNNPLLSGQSTAKAKHASDLLAILGSFVKRGEEAFEELKVFTGIIKGMADEGRGPTKAERDILRQQRAATHAGYQAEKARILGEQEEETLTEAERLADENAEAARVAIAEEIAALEAKLAEEGLTDEEQARLAELKAPTE